MPTITIDDLQIEIEDGATILTAARALNVEIPTFCYQDRLAPLASCRMCLVQIDGVGRLQPACSTIVSDGMTVVTQSKMVADTRREMLEMILANHPLDCPTCDKGGECELQDMVFTYGADESKFSAEKRVFHSKDVVLNQVIVMNNNRCIQCQRCVRVCEDVVGAVALGTVDRGMDSAVTGFANSLAGCDHCGNCVEVCPVGALMSRPYRYKARPWDLTETDTTCPFCGVGCHLTVGQREGRLMRVRSKWDKGINKELLCVKGRFGLDAVDGEGRIEQPMIRRGGDLVPVSWDEVGIYLRSRLDTILAGSDAGAGIGGLASPRLTNETLYQFQKLMRTVFQTNNIDTNHRWSATFPYQRFGSFLQETYSRRPLAEVLDVDCILIVGSSVGEETPVAEYLTRGAVREGSAKLFVMSARPSRLDGDSISFLRRPPGDEVFVLASLLSRLSPSADALPTLDAEEHDQATVGFLDAAGTALANGRSVTVLLGTDVLRSGAADVTLAVVQRLQRVCRDLGKEFCAQFLFDRPNQLGAYDLGVFPDRLPGGARLSDNERRTRFETAWRSPMPANPGIGYAQMLARCLDGTIGTFFVVGCDPVGTLAGDGLAAKALSTLDLLIVQDAFRSATTDLAHVVLPSATFGEEVGTFTNNEGRVQEVRAFRTPAFQSKTNLDVLSFIASAMGQALMPTGPDAVRAEISKLTRRWSKVGPDTLQSNDAFTLPTPRDDGEAPDAPSFAPFRDLGKLVLITGDSRFHSGRATLRSSVLGALEPGAHLEIGPSDATTLGLNDGDQVIVGAKHRQLRAQVRITKRFPKGFVFVPEGFLNSSLCHGADQQEYPVPVEIWREPDTAEPGPTE